MVGARVTMVESGREARAQLDPLPGPLGAHAAINSGRIVDSTTMCTMLIASYLGVPKGLPRKITPPPLGPVGALAPQKDIFSETIFSETIVGKGGTYTQVHTSENSGVGKNISSRSVSIPRQQGSADFFCSSRDDEFLRNYE